jgi:aspartate/tyrosine/aromatic aminotransferase
MLAFQADERVEKVDLVVGVYKDAAGAVPVMRAVKSAETRLIDEEVTKTYVGMAGDPAFRGFVPALLLGENATQIAERRVSSLQTPGGSGALKVGCDLLNSILPGGTLWVSDPTWANHVPVATDAGLTTKTYPYFRPSDRGLDFEGMINHVESNAKPGDAILLHACCHNPTGVDLATEQWDAISRVIADRKLLPFVDCAYQGLGEGMEQDVAGLRILASRAKEMLIASSFSKNFAVYRERTGALTLIARDPEQLAKTQAAAETVIRSNYSMPPSHGARIVATVLGDDALRADWTSELDEMRERIAEMRRVLRQKLEDRQIAQDLSFLTDQKGMFSYTGFTPDQVEKLRTDFGIYTAKDGRINVAGLSQNNLDKIADGFAAVLRD